MVIKKKIQRIVLYIAIPIFSYAIFWLLMIGNNYFKEIGLNKLAGIFFFVDLFFLFIIMMIVMPILMIRMAIKHLREYKWDPLYITIYSTIFIAAMLPLFKAAMFGFGMAVG